MCRGAIVSDSTCCISSGSELMAALALHQHHHHTMMACPVDTMTNNQAGRCGLQLRQQHHNHRAMRRFARRRRALAAFAAVMGRLGRSSNSTDGHNFSKSRNMQYDRLVEEQCIPIDDDQQQQQQQQHHNHHHHHHKELVSYCCCRCGHTQKLKAEELNTIVGNAFRMAYVAQLQRQPMLQDVISSKSCSLFHNDKNQKENRTSWDDPMVRSDSSNDNNNSSSHNNNNVDENNKDLLKSETPSIWQASQSHHQIQTSSDATSSIIGDDAGSSSNSSNTSPTSDMNLQLGHCSSTAPTLRLSNVKAPNSIHGLRPHNFGSSLLVSSIHNNCGDDASGFGETTSMSMSTSTTATNEKSVSQQSTPSSEESNSPTELNSYKRLTDKPPLIKRLAMGLTGRDVLSVNGEDDSCPLVGGDSTPTSPTRPHSGGYINEAIVESDSGRKHFKLAGGCDHTDGGSAKNFNIENSRLTGSCSSSSGSSSGCSTEPEYKLDKLRSHLTSSSCSAGTTGADGSLSGLTPTPPPPLPERHDSLSAKCEEAELRRAPWFQAGIPREITLEVLNQEPEGAFMVRESTSKPGCYALSLRVPRDFQPSGIAHYLIMRTNKGYKIKGFTKEFTTLTALITHHSVMPELLPCPLSLSRYNPSFAKTDLSRDFADIDSDPDYNTLADFRKMMADLNV